MFILLFLCWVVFNQNFTLEIACFGVAVSGAVFFFACKFMDFSIKKDLYIMKSFPSILAYIAVLVWEVIKANVALVKLSLTKKNRKPVIVEFRTKLKTGIARALLANSITLTPGTITAGVEGDLFRIHCFDESLAEGLDALVFEKRLLKLEGGFTRVNR